MSFVATLALVIGVLVVVPILAHLLRRGRAKEVVFPPTRFVPAGEHVAKRRSRFEDRLLLAIRAIVIVLLALLGATPLLRCERAVLTRHDGASVAVVVVLDDSASMRSRLASGESKFERAKRAARELVDQLEAGDSMGVVLAGKPARVQLLPTPNSSVLTQQLSSVRESDRATDLESAIALAESALDRQPHHDKRVVVLSDLGGALPKLSPRVSNPLPELSAVAKDCGVVSAVRNRGRITVDVACSRDSPSVESKLMLAPVSRPTQSVQTKSFLTQPGRDSVVLDNATGNEPAIVRIAGGDENPSNDTAPVIDGNGSPIVATFSDPVTGRGTTGGPPLIEQALLAINANLSIRPLSTIPEDERELASVQLLLLDDPPLLSAESRSAIVSFVERGGVAVALCGPAASSAQLGSLMAPFVERRATWEATAISGLDVTSVAALGAAAGSLGDISPKGRFVFDESQDPQIVVRGRWSDQKQFWIERPLGRGIVVTIGLPASVGQSDLALRTGFVALLEGLLTSTERLGTARVTTVGKSWRFPNLSPFVIEGPLGRVSLDEAPVMPKGDERRYAPSDVGRYLVTFGKTSEERIALFPVEEILEVPRPWPTAARGESDKAAGRFDLSRPLVFVLIPLLVLELAMSSALFATQSRRLLQALAEWRRGRRLSP